MDNLHLYIESLIFTSQKAIAKKEIKTALNAYLETPIKDKEIDQALETLTKKYEKDKYPFEIVEISGGFQYMTKGTYYPIVSQHLRLESKKKLSRAALETLAIISYKQPLTKTGIESIRGVNCDYTVQKLLEKELVVMVGRAEGPGRPLLYGTTEKFMNHFGLKSLNDLPKIKEFEVSENQVGPQSDVVVSPEEKPVEVSDESPETNIENQEQEVIQQPEVEENNEEVQQDEESSNENEATPVETASEEIVEQATEIAIENGTLNKDIHEEE